MGQVCGGWDLTSQGDGVPFFAVLQHQKSWKSFGKVGDSRRGAKDAKDGVSWKICSLQIRLIADWMKKVAA